VIGISRQARSGISFGLMNRRDFVMAGGAGTAGILFGCNGIGDPGDLPDLAHLTSRPRTPSINPTRGKSPLGLAIDRDGFIYVPPNYSAAHPASLLVLCHGAGRSSADWTTAPLDSLFGDRNIVVVAPDSRDASWDIRYGSYGRDVEFIDLALSYAFARCAINPSRIALGGFSDGASYAVSLGLTNGDLFTHVLGFSPGFYRPDTIREKPKVFLSHGTSDPILPFSWTSTQLAPSLVSKGYDVKFVEFDGGHQLPLSVATEAMDWFIG
jgi:predicted esterase